MDLPFDVDGSGGAQQGGTLAFKVLLVDDEHVVRDVLSRLLSREADLAVADADSAEAALELLRAEHFDMLITDKNLPGIGGVELIAQGRRLRPGMDAMMVTGYPSAESIITALAAGASDYLVKPFDDVRLVRAKVRAALERRSERARSRDAARTVAQQAEALLQAGHDVPEEVWRGLEQSFSRYEQALRGAGAGRVVVLGAPAAVERLNQGGIPAALAEPESAEVALADVVVLPIAPGWKESAERILALAPDVVLLGSPESDLSDLLDALSLRLELVDAAGEGAAVLPERVRACLDRRCVQRAQAEVAQALTQFRQALDASPLRMP